MGAHMKAAGLQEKWKQHVESYRNGGLTKTDYCKTHKIGYHQFGYWLKKFNAKTALVPIRLKTPTETEPTVLCSLHFKQGVCLKIHDLKSLGVILGMLGSHAV